MLEDEIWLICTNEKTFWVKMKNEKCDCFTEKSKARKFKKIEIW